MKRQKRRGNQSAPPTPTTDRNAHHCVALVSDFFFPRLGGVENHIWSLAQELLKLGHKVIVVTHAYGNEYQGVHYFGEHPKLKVYYCPFVPMVDQDCLPTFTATFPLLRWIFLREQVDIVHAHQATSTLANESVVYAGVLGIASIFTDHSLFGLHDVAGVILNRVLTTTLATVDAAICVSTACRDNFLLRTATHHATSARRVFVIPNAVNAAQFQPPTQPLPTTDRITVVVVSRLAYRKGMDLLVGIIPVICRAFADRVDFLIAGDGPKRLALQEMVEAERLQERVQFLGAVPHSRVRDVLVQGHIFLNCSLTESFCIAILEASCAGLTVVSTNVGGIPEVLDEGVRLADPNVPDMVVALQQAIEQEFLQRQGSPVDPWPRHGRLAERYAWNKVAKDTVKVYDYVRFHVPRKTFVQRLECYLGVGGRLTGLVVALLAVTLQLFSHLVAWWQPSRNIDLVVETTTEEEHHHRSADTKTSFENSKRATTSLNNH